MRMRKYRKIRKCDFTVTFTEAQPRPIAKFFSEWCKLSFPPTLTATIHYENEKEKGVEVQGSFVD